MAAHDALAELLIIVAVVVVLDNVGFWRMANWSRQFSGKSPEFTYIDSLFPRFITTLLGCLAFYFAKQSPNDGFILFVISIIMIGGSNAFLYYKVIKSRRDDRGEG